MDNFTNLLMDECPPELQSPDDDIKETNAGMIKNNATSKSKGVAMSFGFKRRTSSAIPTLTNINVKKDCMDSNGNDEEIRTTSHNKRSTKLPAPSKMNASTQQKPSRFGFRPLKMNRTSKTNETTDKTSKNYIIQNTQYKSGNNTRPVTTFDNNRNRSTPNKTVSNNQMGKFILQTTQLPKPQSVRVLDTKSTKTLMNNNTKLDNLTFRRFYPSDFGRKMDASGGDLGETSSEFEESFEAPKLPSVFQNAGNSSAFERKETDPDASQKTPKTFSNPTKTSTVKIFLKSTKIADNNRSSSDDQEWEFGGEAMADEPSLSLTCKTETQSNSNKKSFIKKTLPLRTEETATLLEDETSPVESLLSFTESDVSKKKNTSDNKDATSPSNSSSLSEGKDDFLIDDEIADQPGLVFDDKSSQHNSETTLMETATPRSRRKLRNFEGSPMFLKTKRNLGASVVSLDTLSPCESIASDDLMMDYEFSQGSFDEGDGRDKPRNDKNPQELDETLTLTITSQSDTTNSDIKPQHEPQKETWAAPLKVTEKNAITQGKPRFFSTSTPTSSPKREGKFGSPRLLRRLNSTSVETEDFVKLQKTTHTALKNDIVNVKAMLFKLRRVLNESETQNPLEQVNGNNETVDEKFELEDLKRQVLFLQGQLEDKEKTVANLQKQLTKMCVDNYITSPTEDEHDDKEVYNAATQTDRIRPIGFVSPTSLTSPGSLISMNEWSRT